jgi:hypothetical protein
MTIQVTKEDLETSHGMGCAFLLPSFSCSAAFSLLFRNALLMISSSISLADFGGMVMTWNQACFQVRFSPFPPFPSFPS